MLHHEFDRLMSAEADELAQLTANRDRLEHEQDRLMQAHYADAIPLAVLKREQDRIAGELDQVTRRLDAHHGEYTDARAHLDDALNLLEAPLRCCSTPRSTQTRSPGPRTPTRPQPKPLILRAKVRALFVGAPNETRTPTQLLKRTSRFPRRAGRTYPSWGRVAAPHRTFEQGDENESPTPRC